MVQVRSGIGQAPTQLSPNFADSPRLSAKRPHLWAGVYNRDNILILLNLRRKIWRRGPGSNRRIKVLQTSPLPLGYRALAGQSYNTRFGSLQTILANPAGAGRRNGAGDEI
jgi:hypothetical protein